VRRAREHPRLAAGKQVGVPARANEDQRGVEGADAGKLLQLRERRFGLEAPQTLGIEASGESCLGDRPQPLDLDLRKAFMGWTSLRGVGYAASRSPSSSKTRPRASAMARRVMVAWRAGRRAEMIAQAAASYGEWKSGGCRPA
jgi:hypothetical protein